MDNIQIHCHLFEILLWFLKRIHLIVFSICFDLYLSIVISLCLQLPLQIVIFLARLSQSSFETSGKNENLLLYLNANCQTNSLLNSMVTIRQDVKKEIMFWILILVQKTKIFIWWPPFTGCFQELSFSVERVSSPFRCHHQLCSVGSRCDISVQK